MVRLEQGLVLTIIMLTINAFLMFGANQVGVPLPSRGLESWMPPSLQSNIDSNFATGYDSNNDTYLFPNAISQTEEEKQNDVLFWLIDFARTTIGFLASLPFKALTLIGVIGNLLTYHMTFMQFIGVPYAIAWLVGVPLSAIMLISMVWFIMEILRSIAGKIFK